MKLFVQIHATDILRSAIPPKESKALLEHAAYARGGPFSVELRDGVLETLSRFASKENPIRVLWANPQLTASEVKSVSWFELQCRHVFRISDTTFENLMNNLENAEVRMEGSTRVRVLSGMDIGNPKIPEKYISSPESGPYFFVMRKTDFGLLVDRGISGIHPISLGGPSSNDFVGISSECYLDQSSLHLCTKIEAEPFRTIRGKVALAYDSAALALRPDVCLGVEDCGDGLGSLLVSAKFKEACSLFGLKGIAFSPVFEQPSPLFDQIRELWKELLAYPVSLSSGAPRRSR